mmetsp:Transcript_113791/g.317827  ORF Transcript_113791/g.317827 Transcript_113791/m.317827 type:complete len:84 (+) Transcript_113791:160-411(+)|eukprot:CAMPEP_0176291822 /NCGR_PEP_ID=MMETSP0121_2-20121125/55755_1 /TAXON_ID=160619 /ORGANISM="Kryptoperidinium foliaceum, Strain CCMP 1326" /LENGTH=83 /DNA_ID=CAMNT_0017632693 /DNA_START=74 /DNA_END=325 /DNA_ORIENTATION=-
MRSPLSFFLIALLVVCMVVSTVGARGAEDRIREIEQQLEYMKGRLEKHLTKEKVIPDDRLSSLKKRMQTYEDQLADLRNGQEL